MMMTTRGFWILDSRVTLAYDNDSQGDLNSRDVTLAYDDDINGNIGSMDLTLANDDVAMGYVGYISCSG